jgi:SAM-dependent methyltransferase
MTWYEKSFGSCYLDVYAHRDGREAERDVHAIVDLIDPDREGPLLDLGCGSGRHLFALHRLGFTHLVGLDLSMELLREAAHALPRGGSGLIMLVRGDMREIPHSDCFATVLSLFTTFGYFASDAENACIVASVGQALRAGGIFLLDYLNRDHIIRNLVPEDEQEVSGMRVRNVRSITAGERRIEKRITVEREGEEPLELFESVRLFSRDEIVSIFEGAGFVRVRSYGSLGGEPYQQESARLVVVGERAL